MVILPWAEACKQHHVTALRGENDMGDNKDIGENGLSSSAATTAALQSHPKTQEDNLCSGARGLNTSRLTFAQPKAGRLMAHNKPVKTQPLPAGIFPETGSGAKLTPPQSWVLKTRVCQRTQFT